eukprot:CAMPEP_0114306156 /NCGR_PEP_ID=MMETSP0059-20121206/16746_1 /TAXON_ID=36894 /ORGANISM="Pyramimonas parkeae, Strain CCMP726" /LENGTH=249 /DNA_ID=CAMNT_0001429455 /DNA_START=20 /DNA_END=769 /DNA_ORIENTATION=+
MAPNVMKYTARGLRHALLLNSPPSLFQPHARNGLGTLATYMATRSIRSPVGARSQVLMGVVAVFNTLDSRPTKNISSTRIVSHNRMICKGKFSSIPGHTTTSAQRAQRESSGRRIVLPGSSAYGGPGDANTGHGDGPLLDVEGPDKLYHELVELGTIWADRNAQAEYLEEGRKILLSELIVKFNADAAVSRALAESKALATAEYKTHMSKMVEARRASNHAKVRFDALKTKIELVRTYEATRRSEMSIL